MRITVNVAKYSNNFIITSNIFKVGKLFKYCQRRIAALREDFYEYLEIWVENKGMITEHRTVIVLLTFD